MFYKSCFLKLFIIVFLFSTYNSTLYGSEGLHDKTPHQEIQRDVIPSGYQHFNIQLQLEKFRSAYDAAYAEYKNNAEALKTEPISGLFDISANTYALIHDYINQDSSRDSKEKEIYLENLKKSWGRFYDMKGQISSSVFQGFYKNLGYIVDAYKNKTDISVIELMLQNPCAYPDWVTEMGSMLENLKAGLNEKLSEYTDLIPEYNKIIDEMNNYLKTESAKNDTKGFKKFGFKEMNRFYDNITKSLDEPNSPSRLRFPREYRDPNINDVIFIPCGNPKPIPTRNISPIHFVRQFSEGSYPAYIAFFDILSHPKRQLSTSKEDKTTRKDPHWSLENGTYKMLTHDFGHIRSQLTPLKNRQAYIKQAYNIQKKLREENNLNDATVLINGLFMIVHERPDVTVSLGKELSPNNKQVVDFFENIANKFTATIMTYDKSSPSSTLSPYGGTSYKQENRDWEFILKDKYSASDGTIKPVQDRTGPFLPIEYDAQMKKMTRPLKDDPERRDKMPALLQEGYARFWSYFVVILKENIYRSRTINAP